MGKDGIGTYGIGSHYRKRGELLKILTMTNRILNRVGRAIFTGFAVVTLTFGMIRLMPGGPLDYMKGQLLQNNPDMSQEEVNNVVQSYVNVNPDAPIYAQYIEYLTGVATGDLGQSVYYQESVSVIIADALPWTVFVMTMSIGLMFGLAIVVGALMGYAEGSKFDVASSVMGIVLTSIPYYVAAVLLVYVLGFQWGWFPTGGRMASDTTVGLNVPFIAGIFYHAALPIASVVLTGFGGWAIDMRGNSIRVLGEDYLRVARLRGLPPKRIALRYVGRNAILPMYTAVLIGIGFVFGGSVILEEIFSYHGVGYYMFQAISSRDYPLMMGAFLVITLAVVVAVFIADLTYHKVDPRAGGMNRESY